MMGTKRPNDRLFSVPMPLLQIDEAFALFILPCANLELTQAQRFEVSKLSSSLRHNPLAVRLASVHFQTFQTTLELGPISYDSSENSDNLIQRFTSLLTENAREDQCMLIKLFILLGRRTVSQDIINLCQRSRRRLQDLQTETRFLRTSNTRSAIQY